MSYVLFICGLFLFIFFFLSLWGQFLWFSQSVTFYAASVLLFSWWFSSGFCLISDIGALGVVRVRVVLLFFCPGCAIWIPQLLLAFLVGLFLSLLPCGEHVWVVSVWAGHAHL